MNFRTDEEKADQARLADSIRRKADAGRRLPGALALYYSDVRPGEGHYPGYRELKPEASEFSAETNKLLFQDLERGR